MSQTHTQTTTTTTTTTQQPPSPPPQVHITITPPPTHHRGAANAPTLLPIKPIILPLIARLHAGYFRITLSLCWQTLLWKTLGEPPEGENHAHAHHRTLAAAFLLMWSLSLITLTSLSLSYILRCLLLSHMVKHEYMNHTTVNYLFAPWISWLLLLQSCSFFAPKTAYYLLLYCAFVIPIIILDVKLYGQWLTTGKRFLSTAATPASQLSVIGNFVGASVAAETGWREGAVVMFALGFVHYVVVFVTLYQRLSGKRCSPEMLRPVMMLFVAAPSMGSLAWDSICGRFDCSSKMLFYLAVFLFISLVSRPNLFKKSMEKFNVVWWSYSYPLTVLALASAEYAQEMKTGVAHLLMIVLSILSILVSFILMVYTTLNTNIFLPRDGDDDNDDSDPIFNSLWLNTINSKTLESLA